MKKTPLSNLTIPILLLIDGSLCTSAAFFARPLGLDPNPSWGLSRTVLLFAGLLLLFLSLSLIFFKSNRFFETNIKNEITIIFFLLIHVWALVFAIYIWFITYGTFTKWDHTSNYYTQLADAFNKGHLYLDVKPNEATLASSDPYEFATRPTQEEVWDMSLYKGKLYLYWGPVPSLLIAPIQRFTNFKVTDIFIDFFFYAGLLIFNSLIIIHLWRNFFPNIPARNVFICIPLIGLLAPTLWALVPSTIYGAAIGAGHFFLMGGIFFLLPLFKQTPSNNKAGLFLAGLFWSCSVGSRAINALPITFMTLMILTWIALNLPRPFNWKNYIQIATSLLIPLTAGAILIGWYNWARFDSPLEIGVRYQLTYMNLNKLYHLTFKPYYFPVNVFLYILLPFKFAAQFPFILPQYIPDIFQKYHFIPPRIFFAGRMSGLLFSAPFLFLSLALPFSKTKAVQEDSRPLTFIIYLLAGSFLLGFLSLLFFFFGAMRYLVDIISEIALLAVIGYWKIISQKMETNSTKSKISAYLSNSVILLTICIGLLLAVTGESSRVQKLNPLFLERMNNILIISK